MGPLGRPEAPTRCGTWDRLAELRVGLIPRAVTTILRHLFGIVNAIVHRVSNAGSESINSRVQALKRQANGYRNRARFRDAIHFHLGDLDLYPRPPLPLKCQ
ncbi:MAG: transposase [Planctomycetota bacterium]